MRGLRNVAVAVVDGCVETFENTEGSLARRLLTALRAGYEEGGDRRNLPYNSAALRVVRAAGGYAGGNDRFVDLRSDNDDDPIATLEELLELHERIWHREHDRNPKNPLTPIDPDHRDHRDHRDHPDHPDHPDEDGGGD